MVLRMISHIFYSTIFAILLAFGSSGATLAQENNANVTFNLFSVDGFVLSDNYTVDSGFGDRFELEVPAQFTFQVPRQDNVYAILNPGDGTDGMHVKVDFVNGNADTAPTDRRLIENLRFVKMTLAPGTPQDRVNVLARILANEGYDIAVRRYEQNEYLGARQIKIGDADAVEVLGKYIDPDLGLMYVRIVGIVNPAGEDSIFAIANVVDSKFDLTSLDDLALTSAGKTIASFEYIGE